MLFERRRKYRIEVQIVPMIDVMFFLVVFFMLFTTFKTNPAGITIDIPQANTKDTQPVEYLVVSVDRDSKLYVDRQQVSLLQLQDLVARRIKDNSQLPVVIEADRRVPWERVIEVVDEICAVGGHVFSFAVAPKE
ncbi:MAG: biopolymer transporter ExbD [Limnochordia bacterium]|jgi:biopolymer transport protein ExbD|nr:biopolymer transporter ExbD [Limnochordia bacterium]MDD2629566.1 biopolymer transporter ExbD [Limnochordia bacterium]MDD4517257.1 biopolymer transporter ExbD [Limnochordia bacterium]